MKPILLLLSMCVCFPGCLGNSSEGTPKLEVNAEEVNFCSTTVGETVVWNNIQLRNTGTGPLKVTSLRLRGDAGCAFTCAYPDSTRSDRPIACPGEAGKTPQAEIVINAGGTLLVRIEYTPSALGAEDVAALVIKSDAENQKDKSGAAVPLAIPMCGIGADPTGDDADAGVDAGDMSAGCTACETPEAGAAYCETR